MFRARQINLLLGTARDYQNDRVSLGRLINVIEGIVSIMDDRALSVLLDEERSDLEQVYAALCNGDSDFDEKDRSIVDRAVQHVIAKAETYLAGLAQDGDFEDGRPD
jgi:hypothetical protein